jgi:hypothetical protein
MKLGNAAAAIIAAQIFALPQTALAEKPVPSFCGLAAFEDRVPATNNTVRFATFNASLNRFNEGDLIADLSAPGNTQAGGVAETIQRARPDILLINEFDYDEQSQAAALFQTNYLSVSQNGAEPIFYPHVYLAPSNTGVDSGMDFNNDGSIGGPDDAYGFGYFEGQYGMLILSMYPIQTQDVRTFQRFLWKDMPGALLPDDPATAEPMDWYSADELNVFRLSSKSHWDVPVKIGDKTVHILASHPTPPVFDGAEDRNGTRNHDEIRFWSDYVGPQALANYIRDDNGQPGGLESNSAFVILGDLNADPNDGDSTNNAVLQLLNHPAIDNSLIPASLGGVDASARSGNANDAHTGSAAFDTGDFNDAGPGNLRVDYVLPSVAGLEPVCGGVFWPTANEPLFATLAGDWPFPVSDHRMVWMDLKIGPDADLDDNGRIDFGDLAILKSLFFSAPEPDKPLP